jgi:hypothetical protein
MTIVPAQHRPDADLLPPPLRALLEAELAAGNGILEVAHSHPAAPIGVYFKLTGPVTTRARATDSELKFYARNSSLWSGEFTDEKGHCYILEAPLPPPPEPDMPTGDSPYQRFVRSMVIDYEKWHDGIGYDLDAIQEAAGDERLRIEADLLRRSPSDWNDVEALATLDTPKARARLQQVIKSGDARARAAVLYYAPQLVDQPTRTAMLVEGLKRSTFYQGLTQTLDLVADFHPPEVVDALLHGSMHRPGEIAANFASMLLYLHGLQKSQHDWDLRPFWLRFNTEVRSEREAVFRELCEKIGRDPTPFLT